jgi:hypothetical protein
MIPFFPVKPAGQSGQHSLWLSVPEVDKPYPFHGRKVSRISSASSIMGMTGAENGPFFDGSTYDFVQSVVGVTKVYGPQDAYIVKVGISVNVE